MPTKQTLEKAWSIIQQPGKWTQGNYALNAFGAKVQARHEDAVCFCSAGAVINAAMKRGPEVKKAFTVLDRASVKLTGHSITFNNDKAKTVQDLAPIWEEAIRSAE